MTPGQGRPSQGSSLRHPSFHTTGLIGFGQVSGVIPLTNGAVAVPPDSMIGPRPRIGSPIGQLLIQTDGHVVVRVLAPVLELHSESVRGGVIPRPADVGGADDRGQDCRHLCSDRDGRVFQSGPNSRCLMCIPNPCRVRNVRASSPGCGVPDWASRFHNGALRKSQVNPIVATCSLMTCPHVCVN